MSVRPVETDAEAEAHTAAIAASGAAVGWYGKIPALGDFASRRLPVPFIQAWDAWLQTSLAASQAALGSEWLSTYLSGPIWRFMLLPGACGDHAWIGVLMPSVDRVGRYFPLTIAVDVESSASAIDCLGSASEWFNAAEDAALDVLDADATLDSFEASIVAMARPRVAAGELLSTEARAMSTFWAAGTPASLAFASERQLSQVVGASLSATSASSVDAKCRGGTIFWTCSPATNAVSLRCFGSLPPPDAYEQMMAVR